MTRPAATLSDRIALWLRDHPEGIPATEIARRFLKIQDARPAAAGRLVSALVGDDPRFRLVGRHLWGLAEVGEVEAESTVSARGSDAFLYGVARPARGDPDLHRFGFLRVEGGEERGETRLDRRRSDTDPLPDDLAALAAGATLVLFRTAAPFRFLLREPSPLVSVDPLRLRDAASAALPRESIRSPRRLARHLEIRYEEGDDPLFEAGLLRSIHRYLEEQGTALPAVNREEPELPFLKEGGREYLDTLPGLPGVYQMRGERGKLLYVGKSRDLRSRVGSYFSGYAALSDAKKEMVRRVVRIDVTLCGSEPEALIEEWRKIRKRRPRYNEKIEVRAGPPGGLVGRNLVLFLPSTDERSVILYLMRADGAMLRVRARRNPKRTASLEEKIGRFFRGGPGGIEEEGAFAILSRWVAEHREEVTMIDAGACRDESDLIRLVIESLGDPEITAGIRLDRI